MDRSRGRGRLTLTRSQSRSRSRTLTLALTLTQLPVPQLLGLRHLSGGQHKRLCTNCVKLEPSEVKFIAELLHTNPLLEALELNGSLIGDGTP